MPPPPRPMPSFFGQEVTGQLTPISRTPARELDISATDPDQNITTYTESVTPPDTSVFQSPSNLMSSTILEKEIEALPASATAAGSDLMSNLKEKAKDMFNGLSRKSTELLNFDHILRKNDERPPSRAQPLSEDELIDFGDAAEITEVTTPNQTADQVGRSIDQSAFGTRT